MPMHTHTRFDRLVASIVAAMLVVSAAVPSRAQMYAFPSYEDLKLRAP
jgi:hypothetical protein